MTQLKSEKEIRKMGEAGRKLARVLKKLQNEVKAGMKTKELDQLAEKLIAVEGGKPNFKNYKGFPAALCTSVNEAAVHQLPGEYQLQSGDILSLDLGLEYKEFQADTATTIGVGPIPPLTQKLIRVTREALYRGIKAARTGNHLGDIGFAVESYVIQRGMGVVKELTGHGIGRELHEDPTVFNFGKKGEGLIIQPGLVICIEPIVSLGSTEIELGEDGFSYRSVDGSLTAHFEQMIAVTSQGPQILTTLL